MNSHFQSSATTWISSAGTFDGIGLGGSRLWLEIHAMPPRNMTTSAGIDHTTSSIGPEYSKVGRYCARLLEARNHQAQPSTSTITGMMIASMIAVASRRLK